MKIETIKELNQKIWYRLIKVIYIFSLIFAICANLLFITEEFFDDGYIVLGLSLYILFSVFIYIGFEILKRSFFYIILGTMIPVDDNYFIKLKKYKKLIIPILIILIITFAYGIWDINKIDLQQSMRQSQIRKDCCHEVYDKTLDLSALKSLREKKEK
ncbi:MAG: hypothetical protein U9O55_00945 [Patescibacteria group bacterium]|nr:hypothetical protein [Patescibacteria group bacterium]